MASNNRSALQADVALMKRQLEAVLAGQERLEASLANKGYPREPVISPPISPPLSQARCDEPSSEPSWDLAGNDELPAVPQAASEEPRKVTALTTQKTIDMPMQARAMFKEGKDTLLKLLSLNDQIERQEELAKQESLQTVHKKNNRRSTKQRVASDLMDAPLLETRIDTCASILILLNTIVIGLSVDHPSGQWSVWHLLDLVFVAAFFCEFCMKLWLHGVKEYFCGISRWSNIFDSAIVLLDITQVILGIALRGGGEGRVASIFRLVRIFRITRIFRAFRSNNVTGLMAMVQGVVGGAKTLAWSVVLFLMMMYVFAVLCRVGLGEEREDHVGDMWPYFNSVPRSMFTIFRCSFGNCETEDGVSIPEHINTQYGVRYGLAYCSFVFFVTIGLFNIISAIFVESTMSAARSKDAKRARARLLDPDRWAVSVATIIKQLLSNVPTYTHLVDSLFANADTIVRIEFPRDFIDEVVHGNEHVKNALGELDIEANDHERLSDILDPDHSGTIGMLELVDGLMRLRGEPRRSDVVSIDLMVRSLQERVDTTLELVMKLHGILDSETI